MTYYQLVGAVCAHTGLCWCKPPPPWPTDAARWERFRLEINTRIVRVRHDELHDDGGTFDPPIPSNVAVRALPTGLVMPSPVTDRSANGQFRR